MAANVWVDVESQLNKAQLAAIMGVSRESLYYRASQPDKDLWTKIQIEKVLHDHPSYGHRRIAEELKMNKKKILRVMNIFNIKSYRRRVKKHRKKDDLGQKPAPYENLILEQESFPDKPNLIWVSDFTYLPFRQKFIYLATVMDLFSRHIVGFNVLNTHNQELTMGALIHALIGHNSPGIIHSDQGSEYTAEDYLSLVRQAGIKISMSHKSSPWENGYQESFYSQFKLELGDTNRFDDLGELAWSIYRQIYYYNNLRIHTKLKMPPTKYVRRYEGKLSTNTLALS